MDINELTIGEAKELANLFGNNSVIREANIYSRYVGKYVICRTRNEGINAGKVLELDETGVILEDARRLYYHIPANKNVSWYEGVAVEKNLAEDYSLTICSKKAEKSIRGADDHAQS